MQRSYKEMQKRLQRDNYNPTKTTQRSETTTKRHATNRDTKSLQRDAKQLQGDNATRKMQIDCKYTKLQQDALQHKDAKQLQRPATTKIYKMTIEMQNYYKKTQNYILMQSDYNKTKPLQRQSNDCPTATPFSLKRAC